MAKEFNGTTEIMRFQLDTGYDSSSYSVAGWCNPDNTDNYGSFYHKGSDYPNRHHNLEFNSGWGGFVFVIANGSGVYGAWSIDHNPSLDTWTHYCVTMNDSSGSNDPVIYENGSPQATSERSAPSGTPVRTSNKFAVANYYDTPSDTGNFVGRSCEFGYWNRILTAGEAAALAKGYSPLFFPNGLIGYFPMLRNNIAIKGSYINESGSAQFEHPRIIYPSYLQRRRYNRTTTSIKKVSSVLYASIKKISGVPIASVKKVAGLA